MRSIFLIFLFLAGKCSEMSAGETVGAGVRGHRENTKDEK